VEDMCGNIESCDYLFTVEDCKKPTPYCRTGIVTVVMPANGTVEVWAEDLNIGSFDNCPGDLIYAFDSLGTQLGRTFDCNELGLIEVEMYVIDASGNFDYCTTTVEIQDPSGSCGNPLTGTISGTVYQMSTNDEMAEANVFLYNHATQSVQSQKTTTNGKYAFANMPMGGEYELTLERNDDPLNGVSTKDLIAIQQHLLGQKPFTAAEEYIAADVNNSASISSRDMLELRKLILGQYSSFEEIESNQRSWRFVKKDHVFTSPTQPWGYPEYRDFDPFTQSANNVDFNGIKIGDIDGSASAGFRSNTLAGRNLNT